MSVGLTQRKSLTIGALAIPDKYFFDFLRGCFDGDGCSYSYWDPRWKSSFMFYTEFCSSSPKFIAWLQRKIHTFLNIKGHITSAGRGDVMKQLKFAKKESLILIRNMYYSKDIICLSRKKLKIDRSLDIINRRSPV